MEPTLDTELGQLRLAARYNADTIAQLEAERVRLTEQVASLEADRDRAKPVMDAAIELAKILQPLRPVSVAFLEAVETYERSTSLPQGTPTL